LNRRDGEGNNPRAEADYARLARYARRLDADIVALQEVDGEPAARRIFDPAIYAFHFTGDHENPQRTGFAYRKSLAVTLLPDVLELALAGTRRGADMAVALPGGSLRLLSVHLKTGCWQEPLDTPVEPCEVLRRQLPAVGAWIGARSRERTAFVLLGDFNRRFDPKDEFWTGMNRDRPPGAGLIDAMAGHDSRCWEGEFPDYIDHIVLSRQAAIWMLPGSLRQLLYDTGDAGHRAALSDHCPVAVTLTPGAPGETPAPPKPPPRIRSDEAARHAGEIATVCGRVASTRYLSASRGQPTFLNLDRPPPDPPLTVVIWGENRAAFGAPETAFDGRRICVTGRIELYHGKPEIVATRPSQIAPAEKQ
jgi:endonuclease/exonuclease/phosphatase family metal-dependent hydrolase